MPSVCFYFQVHQPLRLKRYTYANVGSDHEYFDAEQNGAIMRKVASKCYLPANRVLLDLIRRHRGSFKVSFSITGMAVEQMQLYAPEVLDSFRELAATGCVEFLAETYHHSLAAIFDREEFVVQLRKHSDLILEQFGVRPRVLRNTELIHDDRIGRMAADLGYRAMLAEGVDDVLGWRSPNFVYQVPGRETRLLIKNYRYSDDIAFRFSNQGWKDFPLTAEKFSRWIHELTGNSDVVGLFVDYETFGEHQWENTGIFDFLGHLPEHLLRHPEWNFATPSEVVTRYLPVSELPYLRLTSWADLDRDISAWQGNRMQASALRQIYDVDKLFGRPVKEIDPRVIDTWRKLQTSDHFYYMSTKWFGDGDVHAYFSPYDSPYDAFINYMNVLRDFREHVVPAAIGSRKPTGVQIPVVTPLEAPVHREFAPRIDASLEPNTRRIPD